MSAAYRHRFGSGAEAWWTRDRPYTESLGLCTSSHGGFIADFYCFGNGGAHFSADASTEEVEYEEIEFTLPVDPQ